MACKEGQFDVVNNKFKTFGINLNAQHVNEMTLLICTVIRNHTVMTLYLNFSWFVDQNDKMERQIQARRPFPQPYD